MITGADQKKAMRNIAAFLVEYIMNDKSVLGMKLSSF